MNDDLSRPDEYLSLYRRAFREYGTRCLWNGEALDHPTADDGLAVARALRVHGDRSARLLAERLETACRAAL